jgi:glycosyltransferase involved in cell wall biosynthesis
MGIRTINLRKDPHFKKNESIAWLEEWAKEAIFSINSRGVTRFDGLVLNFSNTLCLPAHVWYAQGPPTVTLDNMWRKLPLHYKLVYLSLSPFFRVFDKTLTRKIAVCSSKVVANSKYLTSIYGKFGIQVNDVVYPPLDCEQFVPITTAPSEDFVLTYFGKETIFDLIKQVLDLGIKVKAFGGKLSMIPKEIRDHANLDFVGRIDDETLINLYSNALFTFYPFTDEPFGYIPIESLACGTPVLTFNKHGPKETITDGETGWLANNDTELLKLAFKVWRKKYPKTFRKACRQNALRFDVDNIWKEWVELLSNIYI